jgi:hypothetical protein
MVLGRPPPPSTDAVCVALTLAMLATLATPAPARLEPTVRVVAGGGTDPSDGVPATDAQLSSAEGVAARPDGTLVIADTYDNRIRQVDRTGTITTIADTGTIGTAGDGGPAREAERSSPSRST